MENFDYSSMIYKIDGSLFHQLHKCYSVPRIVEKKYISLHKQFCAILKKRNSTYFNLGEYSSLYNDEFKNLYQQYLEFDRDVQKLGLVERVITII